MKKVFFLLVMMMVGMTASMNAQTWAQVGPGLANEVNELGDYMSQTFASQGIPATARAQYSSGTKSVDIIIDFGSLDIVPFLDNNTLNEVKKSFIEAFIDSMKQSPDGLSDVREMADIMTKDGGTLRIVFAGAGKQKSVSITGSELKRAL